MMCFAGWLFDRSSIAHRWWFDNPSIPSTIPGKAALSGELPLSNARRHANRLLLSQPSRNQ
jgi:hypothetical protein